jgi:hypothetical protein
MKGYFYRKNCLLHFALKGEDFWLENGWIKMEIQLRRLVFVLIAGGRINGPNLLPD